MGFFVFFPSAGKLTPFLANLQGKALFYALYAL